MVLFAIFQMLSSDWLGVVFGLVTEPCVRDSEGLAFFPRSQIRCVKGDKMKCVMIPRKATIAVRRGASHW